MKIDLIIAKYRYRQYQGNHRFTWLGLILLLVIVLVMWTTSLIKMALVLMLLIVLIVLLIGTLIACQLSLNRLRAKIDLMTSILETRGESYELDTTHYGCWSGGFK